MKIRLPARYRLPDTLAAVAGRPWWIGRIMPDHIQVILNCYGESVAYLIEYDAEAPEARRTRADLVRYLNDDDWQVYFRHLCRLAVRSSLSEATTAQTAKSTP